MWPLNAHTGLDLVDFAPMFNQFQSTEDDVARKAILVGRMIQPMQDSFTAIEKVCHSLSGMCCRAHCFSLSPSAASQ